MAPVDPDCPNIICFLHPISYVSSTIFVHIVFISSYKKKIKNTVETVFCRTGRNMILNIVPCIAKKERHQKVRNAALLNVVLLWRMLSAISLLTRTGNFVAA
jgi:hypothetical protein